MYAASSAMVVDSAGGPVDSTVALVGAGSDFARAAVFTIRDDAGVHGSDGGRS